MDDNNQSLADALNAADVEEKPEGAEPPLESEPKEELKDSEVKKDEPKKEDPKKDRPFHKNPKFLRLKEQAKQAKEQNSLVETLKAEMAELRKQLIPSSEKKQVPDKFKHVFGEDAEAFDSFQSFAAEIARTEYENARKAESEKTMLSKKQEEEATQQFISSIETGLESLSDEVGEDLTENGNPTRNAILDVIEKYGVTDDNGMPDPRRAYELYKALSPKDTAKEQRKQVAGLTSDARAIATDTEDITSKKLRGKSLMDYFNN